MWEKLKDEAGAGGGRGGYVAVESHRLRIPGGWLVRTIVCLPDAGGAHVTQTFVADDVHQWRLE